MKKIESLKIKENMLVKELVSEMSGKGFGAGNVSRASRIMEKMFSDDDCRVFLGVAGALVPAGMKEVIIDMLPNIDVLVVTGATLTHDLVEALGDSHYLINEFDDVELNKSGWDRMYNVVMNNKAYEKLESFFQMHSSAFQNCKTIKELIWKIGELVENKCILKTCYEKKIPVFCPALADSGIGLMIWGRIIEGKKFDATAFGDMNDIIDLAWSSKKSGVIYIGGGVPKNFIQQALQFSHGASYGIQITTDRQEPGGSSGAPLKEGISWGKLKYDADFVDVFCDATIALPLIYASIK